MGRFDRLCKRPFPYWPHEEYDGIYELFGKRCKGQFRSFELVFQKKNGERFPVVVNPSACVMLRGEIINYIATVKDISERKAAENIIKFQATHDELTGLGNRRAFEQILQQLFEQTRNQHHQHVLVT